MRWLERIESFADEFRAWDGPDSGVTADEPLAWPGYADVLHDARAASASVESVVTGRATIRRDDAQRGDTRAGDSRTGDSRTGDPRTGDAGRAVALIASAFEFVGGSMGIAAGERMVRAYDRARAEGLPVLLLARSGGARLQEGMAALAQMARVVDAARRHADAGLLQVAYLDSPTTGGVYASAASIADVVWAAPGALVGFAGPRVVELTTGEHLAADAHTAESALAAGIVDAVLDPRDARAALARLLALVSPYRSSSHDPPPELLEPPSLDSSDAWTQLLAVRDASRPSAVTWLDRLVPDRVELRGDRAGGTDPVVVAGLGRTVAGTALAFTALDRNAGVGRPRPAGYRTARRAIALAARLRLPVLTLVDTPGADPSDESERAGIAGEIARTLAAITGHPAPTVSIVVGEGGSGGALAFAATDRCYLLDGAVFEVISPEGAAAILLRDPDAGPQVAQRLGVTGGDLLALGVVDGVIEASEAATAVEHAVATARPGDGRSRLDAAQRAAGYTPSDEHVTRHVGRHAVLVVTGLVAVAVGLALAALLLFATGRGGSAPKGPFSLGGESTLVTEVREGGPAYFADPTGGPGLYLVLDGGRLVALSVRVPGTRDCNVRWRSSRHAFQDCRGRTRSARALTLYPLHSSRGLVFVDTRVR